MTDGPLGHHFRLPKDPAGIFHLAATLIAGFVLILLVDSVRTVPQVTLLFLGLLVLGGIGVTWVPPLVFAFVAITLFQVPNHFLGIIPNFDAPLSTKELFLGGAFIIYASLSYRFARVRAIADILREPAESDDKQTNQAIAPARVASLLVTITVGIAIAYVARWLLPFMFIGRQWGDAFHLHPGVLGFLFAILLLGAASLLWPAIIRGIGRWGMNKQEGEMILNESLFRDMWPDITRMARLRQRFDRKRK